MQCMRSKAHTINTPLQSPCFHKRGRTAAPPYHSARGYKTSHSSRSDSYGQGTLGNGPGLEGLWHDGWMVSRRTAVLPPGGPARGTWTSTCRQVSSPFWSGSGPSRGWWVFFRYHALSVLACLVWVEEQTEAAQSSSHQRRWLGEDPVHHIRGEREREGRGGEEGVRGEGGEEG